MKNAILTVLAVMLIAGVAVAQTDVLGAHLVYGRGCVACHAPHSGAAGNGGSNANSPYSGNNALWGQDLSPLYGQTLQFGDKRGNWTITLPNYGTTANGGSKPGNFDQFGGPFAVIACLSCHDDNLAKPAMMQGTTVEALPNSAVSGGHAPTFLGNDGTSPGNYLNDHPVGPNALLGCGGTFDWDCTINANGTYSYTGAGSSQFLTDYFDVTKTGPVAHLVSTGTNQGGWVTCTTCHDQHSMTVFSTDGTVAGSKPTMFFVRGWYNPNSGNSAAQFCRSCHGGESNEMHGQNVTTY
jgi:cytochrome c553